MFARWRRNTDHEFVIDSINYVLDGRLQPTAMLYLVGLLSGAQVVYNPADLHSYEARNGASFAQSFKYYFIFLSMYRRLRSTRLIQYTSERKFKAVTARVARYYRYTGVSRYLGVPVRYRGIYEYNYSTAVCGHHTVFF